ncbi:GspE/PulE family protein [Chitinimonas sp. BJYL2]|uniref:GspE/PulE family protein n=1 Tax=Chitinimonas sp. BJYL2 TaxID=2976696 RepID=UPI0022B521A0|nr:type II/IV secretion system protein [Chitinimonas sp. BJYL2]
MDTTNTERAVRELILHDVEALKRFIYEVADLEAVPLGRMLREHDLVSDRAIEVALAVQQKQPGRRIGDILVGLGLIDQHTLDFAVALLLGTPRVALENFVPTPDALARFPAELVYRHQLLPLFCEGEHIVLAAAKLPDQALLDTLRFATQLRPLIVLAERGVLEQTIESYFDPSWAAIGDARLKLDDTDQHEVRNLQRVELEAKQQPIVQLVDTILLDAIRHEASDIHLVPDVGYVSLQYRIHGTLVPIRRLDAGLLRAVVGRVKIISRLNIAEHRLPQDGHARVVDGDNKIDLRVSNIPTLHGESVVIRILNKRRGILSLGEVGFSEHDERVFRDLISHNNGMLLVTGPTGSGKTTTLYAALQQLLGRTLNIVTVEDPVEYELPGVRQIQLTEAIDFGFPRALRHILRHDPDVVMIGEIRDAETARIALESALTGHFVASTLHTNNASQAVLRLQEMGMSNHLIRTSLLGVLGQRLVRRNCSYCKAPEAVADHILQRFGVAPSEPFYHGTGCAHCHGTGFSGRIMVYEIMPFSHRLREQIAAQVSSATLERVAIEDGMRPLHMHGLSLAQQGIVSLTEVYQECL